MEQSGAQEKDRKMLMLNADLKSDFLDEDDSQGKLGKGVIAYQASNAELLNEVENKELQQKKLDKKKKKKGQMNFL